MEMVRPREHRPGEEPAALRHFSDGPERRELHANERLGRNLLAIGWTALLGARAEAVDIHLRTGAVVRRAIALRVEGALAQASTRRGQWTHSFALDQVVMVEQIPRGGRMAEK